MGPPLKYQDHTQIGFWRGTGANTSPEPPALYTSHPSKHAHAARQDALACFGSAPGERASWSRSSPSVNTSPLHDFRSHDRRCWKR